MDNDRIIASVGNFDGVHLGHRHLLAQMRDLADRHHASIVAVTFTTHPLTLIRPQRVPLTLTPLDVKTRLLLEAGADRVVALDFDERLRALTSRQFMTMLRDSYGVCHVVTGYNNSFGSDRPSGIDDYLAAAPSGVTVSRAMPLIVDGIHASSTAIRHALTGGDLPLANRLLGRPYSVTGTVIAGRRLGRTLGFPTANIALQPIIQPPSQGVYAAIATTGGHSYPAMVNIGVCPTVEALTGTRQTAPAVEAHLIGFEGDLYGHPVTLDFIERIRDEVRFDSLAALSDRLRLDRAATLAAARRHA